MTEIKYIDVDIVKVYKFGKEHKDENLLATLFWGDNVRVTEETDDYKKLDFTKLEWNEALHKYEWNTYEGEIPAETKFRNSSILKVRFVDVGQGDAAIIESPAGKIILLDGGEQDNLLYYIKKAWAHILRDKSLEIETIVVTHGDADHFVGLTKVLEASRYPSGPLITTNLIYHNGLVKAPTNVGISKIFGDSKVKNGKKYVVDLVDDLRTVPDLRLNDPFKKWKKALQEVTQTNSNLKVQRLVYGDQDAFNSLGNEDIKIQVLGPIVEDVDGDSALPYLHAENSTSYSASHTINGHSVVLKLTYGNVKFLFGADLNAESEAGLIERARADDISLSSEILKVPHHGSADFTPKMLEAVRPTVSVVSSGDESESVEYIHPRAGLVGALGKYSNVAVEKPLVYVTEMVAFFKRIGRANICRISDSGNEIGDKFQVSNAYEKISFGIVHVRTDGERVLVATHSGKPGEKESYAFKVDKQGKIEFEKTVVL